MPGRTDPTQPKKELDLVSPHFDLALARISLFIDVISYAIIALVPTALAFTLGNMSAAMGSGFSPAIYSVALALYRRRGGTESGRLFGALGVVQGLCSQILGPAIYGLVYMKTVATFPQAIYFASVIALVISCMLLVFVKLPKEPRDQESLESGGDEDSEDADISADEVGLEVDVVRERSSRA